MSETVNLRSISIVILQLVVIVASTIAAYYFTREYSIIPKAVLHLPDVYVSPSDMWNIARIFFTTYLVQIIGTLLWYRSHAFTNGGRFANEYVFYLVAYTVASLYLFLATTINYDPQLVAATGLFSTIAYLLIMFARQLKLGSGLFASVTEVLGALFSRILSISGVAALVFFLTPLALGKAFTSDRDIANVITQVRIFFNPVEESEWGFKNKFPGITFEQPLLVVQTPGQSNSVYVFERVGKVYEISGTAGATKELVLDISGNLGEVEVENGAIGLAFHPRFHIDQPFAFVYYTDTRPDGYQLNKLSRFDMSLPSLEARKLSELTILELVRRDDGFHNGGSVAFGPDGFLYVALGEGVHPPEFKTSSEAFRGGILRLDVDMDPLKSSPPGIEFKHGKAMNYLVPNDNPFVGNPRILDEFWALGLRNPFRFNFDPETGDLWVGDVGSTIWEEVNLIEKGKHYQFPATEGRSPTGVEPWEDLGLEEQGPVYTYEHNAYDRAVIGGVIDRGELYGELKGRYIFADSYSGKIFAMDLGAPQVEEVDLLGRANQYAQRGVSSVVQLRSGEILVTTLGAASEASGEVLQLVRADQADVFANEETDDTPREYDEEAIASLFAINCTRCHGASGDGNGPDSEMLGVDVPDLTLAAFYQTRTTEQLNAVITDGGVAHGMSPMMPPWGGFLKEQEIEHLVTYLQSLPDKGGE